MKKLLKEWSADIFFSILAGSIVAFAYFFFQNSNGFAPGGIGGLATLSTTLFNGKIEWAYFLLLYSMPILILATIYVNKRLGVILMIYILTQSLGVKLLDAIGAKAYCAANNGEDFEIVFACIATGVISGLGFAIMLKRFGASGGTYAISALIKKRFPGASITHLSFIMDSSIVFIAFFVYGMKITPVICTLINLFIANTVVDYSLAGGLNAYKFEIITDAPDKVSEDIISTLKHGVTEMKVVGMFTHTEKYMVVCIVRKKEVGTMMKIIQKYPGTFANFSKVNEVFGRFKK